MDKETVLCVGYGEEDLERLTDAMEAEGWLVWSAPEDESCLQLTRDVCPSLIAIQPTLSGEGRLDWVRRLRDEPASRGAAIVLLSSGLAACATTACESQGADDCLYGIRPLEKAVTRLKSILRRRRLRASVPPGMRVEYHGIVVDTDKHELRVDGLEVLLNLSEFQLVVALASSPGKVFTREQILRSMQRTGSIDVRNIDVRVRSIRHKLGNARDAIATVRGVGYKLASRGARSPSA